MRGERPKSNYSSAYLHRGVDGEWTAECCRYPKVEDECYVYPSEYFCPVNVTTGRIHVEKNTRTIHHYAGTWVDKKFSVKDFIKKLLPEKLVLALINYKNK